MAASLIVQPSDYRYLRDLIYHRSGLSIDGKPYEDIVRTLERLMRKTHASGIHSLLLSLYQTNVEDSVWQDLLRDITVGETYFFRNIDQFNALRNHILPELIQRRRQAGFLQLRLWSAGCATGEEPYSLAILLRELLPDYDAWYISLMATDINRNYLEAAQRGIYKSRSFRNETPPDLQGRWFTQTDEGYEIDPSIRRMVKFGLLNLTDETAYPTFESGTINVDIIICRNVTIYFNESVTRGVVGRFHTALNDFGWLVVGHAEPTLSMYQEFAACNFVNTVVYQKRANPHTTPQPFAQPLPVKLENPRTPTIDTWQRAKSAADREDWQTALMLLAQAEHEDRLQPQVYYLRALIQLHNRDVDGAYLSLRQVVYCDPTFALAHYSLGEFHEKKGELKEAERHWKIALSAISSLNPADFLPFSDDLTVETLDSLLRHKLDSLEK